MCRTLAIFLALIMAGCSSTPDSRYELDQDRGPANEPDVSHLENAKPRYEAPRKAGNKSPYTVWGKQYTVMSRQQARNYVRVGKASWYGEKFHGHLTSNGETFDMYAMSAAHKSLPIPSYARVTNLANGRQVVVRVNDRGPFHGDRLIDLSWAAAKKLGYSDQGTARVRIETITVDRDGTLYVAKKQSNQARTDSKGEITIRQGHYVQVGSFSQPDSAHALSRKLKSATSEPVRVRVADGWHRVQVGPFDAREPAEAHRGYIESRGFGQPIVVEAPTDQ